MDARTSELVFTPGVCEPCSFLKSTNDNSCQLVNLATQLSFSQSSTPSPTTSTSYSTSSGSKGKCIVYLDSSEEDVVCLDDFKQNRQVKGPTTSTTTA